jgi:hypothetical protein
VDANQAPQLVLSRNSTTQENVPATAWPLHSLHSILSGRTSLNLGQAEVGTLNTGALRRITNLDFIFLILKKYHDPCKFIAAYRETKFDN